MNDRLPADWADALADRLDAFDLGSIGRFVDAERSVADVFPPEGSVFRALELTPLASVRAVILGQDPYHQPGQAEGLAFSVSEGKWPPSLRNIVAELCADIGCPTPVSGSLEPWARNGVLLLNTVLTVRYNQPNGHAGHGWEQLTSAIVDVVAGGSRPVAFLLWGRPAQVKGVLVDRARHAVVECPHPSPLSAYRGFLGSRPFSAANAGLLALGADPIDWHLD